MEELDRVFLRRLGKLRAPGCPSTEVLGDFVERRVGPEEQKSLEAHLRVCPSCLNRLIELRELVYLERAGESPPPDLVRRTKGLLSSEEEAGFFSVRILRPLRQLWEGLERWRAPYFSVALASAAALLLVFVGLRVLREGFSGGKGGIGVLGEFSAPEKRLLQALFSLSPDLGPLYQRLTLTLRELPKNLLLEQTRGASGSEVYRRAAPATVLILTEQGEGSGVVISPEGEVLTGGHVVSGAKELVVVFKPESGEEGVKGEKAFSAILLKEDPVADLALLRVEDPPEGLSFLSPEGTTAPVGVGQRVYALGIEGKVWTYAEGTVRGVHPQHRWVGPRGLLHEGGVIEVALSPGSSGGPLLSEGGEVLGFIPCRGKEDSQAGGVEGIRGFLRRARGQAKARAFSAPSSSYRTESYGGGIVGVYVEARVPPPDLWLVYEGGGQPVYGVTRTFSQGELDTVIVGMGPGGKGLTYYFDLDCDGGVDLVGYRGGEGSGIGSYGLPEGSLRVADLAGELAKALKERAVPYPRLQVCGGL